MSKKKKINVHSNKFQEAITGYAFTALPFLGFCFFTLFCFAWAVLISFQKYDVFTAKSYFVNFDNYVKILSSTDIWQIFKNTVWYAVFCSLGNTIGGVLLALAINAKIPRKISVFVRSIYFFPTLIGLSYVAILWTFMLATDYGLVNFYLGKLGIPKIPFLNSTQYSKLAVWIVDVWKNVGFSMLLVMAGLQNIDNNLLEAAEIDGANKFQSFFRITLPLLTPQIFFILIIHVSGALKLYESSLLLTKGGPGVSSQSLVMEITDLAFGNTDYGRACALSLVLTIFTIIVTALQFAGSKWWVNYD